MYSVIFFAGLIRGNSLNLNDQLNILSLPSCNNCLFTSMAKPPCCFCNTSIGLYTKLYIEFLLSLEQNIQQIGKYIYNLLMTGYIVI